MYFDASVILLIVLITTSKYMDSAPLSNDDDDTEWETLFGHLSQEIVVPRDTKPNKFFLGKQGQSRPSIPNRSSNPPTPPEAPFVFDSNKETVPSIGANSQGGMEGIAISQNRGISLGVYMVNSTSNNFNTVFGHSNITQPYSTLPIQ